MAWVILAGFALAYLSGLYVFYASGGHAALTPEPGASAPSAASADMAETAEGLREEIATLRRQVEQMGERIEAMEAAFGYTAALPPQEEEAGITAGARSRARPAGEAVSVTHSSMPEDGFGDIGIEASPLPVAGNGRAMRTLFAVELASGASPEAVRKKWAELGAEHKALLAGLQARHKGDGDAGDDAGVRLIAGPFPNAAEAARLCASLRAAGTDCTEAVFGGKPF